MTSEVARASDPAYVIAPLRFADHFEAATKIPSHELGGGSA